MTILILMETPLGRDIIQAIMMYVHSIIQVFRGYSDTLPSIM
jgi:hypothetical protein